ncbi:MAG: hypothetical protein DRN30_00305 [Thermoplasmata archaeon]|nr:hypothetical protein [Euryarchaeota archaeon]RLF67279.1 MAG: hypothetical protein DRN30_00305 [Thermoplasmata archaeon]
MPAQIILKMPNGEIRKIEIQTFGKSIEEILVENNIAPDSVVVLKEGTPIPVTEKLKDGDTITAIIAFSGG